VASDAKVTQKKEQQRILDSLLEKTGRTLRDDSVDFDGDKIVLPRNTTLDDNINFLVKLKQELEEGTAFSRIFQFKIWDVAHATSHALRTAFGSMRHTGTWLEPPSMEDIPCGPNQTVQVPFGQFIVPALPDVQFSVQKHRDPKFGIVGAVTAMGPKKYKAYVESIFDLVENELLHGSLYRGKAFTDDDKPEFIDTDSIDPSRIVYSAEVTAQIAANVYVRLDYPEVMKDLDIPFKSAHLLEGEFGVGKTEALNLIAKRAVEKKITFIKVGSGGDLMMAMQTARMYSPSIVAFEDVDAVGSADNESDRIQQVLEAFDGQQAKLHPVMVLITTNYVESLHKGMVRPGRIDSIIHIGPPDAEGIKKLIEARSKDGLLNPKVEWDKVAEAMDGYFPSFVVEATGRAIRYGVMRIGGELADGDLTTSDLVNAAVELRPQFNLHSNAATGVERPPLEQALEGVVKRAVGMGDDAEDNIIGSLTGAVEIDGDETRGALRKYATGLAKHTTNEHEETRTAIENN